MIERRRGPDAHELLGADFYLGNADIVMEVRNDILGHGLDCLLAIGDSTITAEDYGSHKAL
jgi:hypothetical protein